MAAVALGSLWLARAPTVAIAVAIVATLLLGTGVVLAGTASAARRERAWEIQAIAVALLAAIWLWGIARPG